MGDFTRERTDFFDLILVLDVVEHLEDYYSFLRNLQPRGTYKIIHLPLDLSVQAFLRPGSILGVRHAHGHLHYFTKALALEVLKDVGYEVLDHFYAPRSLDLADNLAKKLLIPPRKLLYALHKDLSVLILGGFSLYILAK